jgi:hypothetical protein
MTISSRVQQERQDQPNKLQMLYSTHTSFFAAENCRSLPKLKILEK